MESSLVKLEMILMIIAFVIFSHTEVRAKDWRLYVKTDPYQCFYDTEDMIRSSQDIVEV